MGPDSIRRKEKLQLGKNELCASKLDFFLEGVRVSGEPLIL